ncbi:MAG: dihydrodipicolinate synthase family protein [Ignavibacteria bacterium]|nr:dihydrodipicolinate synthase family protein [Ignavibacteria bacterium]
MESNPTPVKAIMSILGLIEPTIRLPLLLLKKENEEKIKDALKKANFLK